MSLTLFDERRAEGAVAERSIQGIFLDSGLWAVSPVNRRASRDFEIRFLAGGQTELVEVKNETRYATSGNIIIETRQGCRGKAAGIMASEATVVIHVLAERGAVYRRQSMVNWILNHKKPRDRRRFSGADNGNEGFVVAIAEVSGLTWFEVCELSSLPWSSVLQGTP